MNTFFPGNGLPFLCVFLVGTALLVSCDEDKMFEQNSEIAEGAWHKDSTIKFEVNVQDTVSFHNLYINIANTGEYAYRNLFVFLDVFSPEGENNIRDTIECMLADNTGKWLGRKAGNVIHNRILFKRNIRFPHTGIYVFEFEQGMRTEALEHIIGVGLRVEKGG